MCVCVCVCVYMCECMCVCVCVYMCECACSCVWAQESGVLKIGFIISSCFIAQLFSLPPPPINTVCYHQLSSSPLSLARNNATPLCLHPQLPVKGVKSTNEKVNGDPKPVHKLERIPKKDPKKGKPIPSPPMESQPPPGPLVALGKPIEKVLKRPRSVYSSLPHVVSVAIP